MFTPEEEAIIKGVVNKLKVQDELEKLEKQRKILAREMNDKIQIESDKAGTAIASLRATYNPQITDLDTQIQTKKDELDAII